MRSIFSIWRDNGRLDYGIARPSGLAPAGKIGMAVVLLAVGAIGVRGVYAVMTANDRLDTLAQAVPTAQPVLAAEPATPVIEARRASPSTWKARPQTVGSAPISFVPLGGANPVAPPDPSPTPASHVVADSRPAPQPAADAAPPEQAKPDAKSADAKSHFAKKKLKTAHHAPAAQVYQLPDGRQVAVRGSVRTAYGYAQNSGFQSWDSFGSARQGRRSQFFRSSGSWF
jgi:hypothetical protein